MMLMPLNQPTQWDSVYARFRGRRSVWREHATPFFASKIEYLGRKGVKSVLDAGCGDARNLTAFVQAGFKVTGVDFSDSALKRAKKRVKGLKVRLLNQDVNNLEFSNNSFDLVLCDFVFAHMQKPKRVLNEFFRVLKKGGFALLEFTSIKSPQSGKGKKIGRHEFMQKGFYLHFYDLPEVERLMKRFKVLAIDSLEYTDPPHGPGYNRRKRHRHHSYFVFAAK